MCLFFFFRNNSDIKHDINLLDLPWPQLLIFKKSDRSFVRESLKMLSSVK